MFFRNCRILRILCFFGISEFSKISDFFSEFQNFENFMFFRNFRIFENFRFFFFPLLPEGEMKIHL